MYPITSMLIDASLKGMAILLLALIITVLMRKSSAAARHLVWSGAVVAVLTMPLLSYLLPGLAVLPTLVAGEIAEPAVETPPQPEVAGTVPDRPRPEQAGVQAEHAPLPAPADRISSSESSLPSAAASDTASTPEPITTPAQPWWQTTLVWLPWIWLGGAVFALIPSVLGCLSLWHLKRTTQPITGGSWQALLTQLTAEIGLTRPVALLMSPCRTMPMTWGALPGIVPGVKAKVLIPEDADDWTTERRRAVLLHELAHIQRRDCLTQLLTQVACALYWFNPLVWYAAQRMLIERERACDDLVLTHKAKASDYARHLLEIATGPQASFFAAHAGIAMARRSKLDGRLVAILDQHRNRRAMSRLGVALTITLLGAVAVPVAMLQAVEARTPSEREQLRELGIQPPSSTRLTSAMTFDLDESVLLDHENPGQPAFELRLFPDTNPDSNPWLLLQPGTTARLLPLESVDPVAAAKEARRRIEDLHESDRRELQAHEDQFFAVRTDGLTPTDFSRNRGRDAVAEPKLFLLKITEVKGVPDMAVGFTYWQVPAARLQPGHEAELEVVDEPEEGDERQETERSASPPVSEREDQGEPAFGPESEITLRPYSTTRQGLDLENGRIHVSPFTVDDRTWDEVFEWVRRTSTDMVFHTDAPGGEEAVGVELVAVPVSGDVWQDMTAEQVRAHPQLRRSARVDDRASEMPRATWAVAASTPLRVEGELPATFLFRTREDAYGILQITGFTDEPEGVKLRYKLVQSAPADAGDAAPVTRVYNVADLLTQHEDASNRQRLLEEVIAAITGTVGRREEWAEFGGDVSDVTTVGDRLVIQTTPANHEQIAELLEQLRESGQTSRRRNGGGAEAHSAMVQELVVEHVQQQTAAEARRPAEGLHPDEESVDDRPGAAATQPQGRVVYLTGQVGRPGAYVLPEQGMTLFQLIASADDLRPGAVPAVIEIVRQQAHGTEHRLPRIRADALLEGEADDIRLQPGDVVVVRPDPQAVRERQIGGDLHIEEEAVGEATDTAPRD